MKMLQRHIPASVYQLLISDVDIEAVNISDEDWHKARCYMLDLTPSGAAKGWVVANVRDFTPEEKACVLDCIVKDSTYGFSMEFKLKNQYKHKDGKLILEKHLCNPHIPCSNSTWDVGRHYHIDELQLASLRKSRDLSEKECIYRVCHKGEYPNEFTDSTIRDVVEWFKWTEKIWNEKLNPIRHAQWDRQGIHTCSRIFRDLILY